MPRAVLDQINPVVESVNEAGGFQAYAPIYLSICSTLFTLMGVRNLLVGRSLAAQWLGAIFINGIASLFNHLLLNKPLATTLFDEFFIISTLVCWHLVAFPPTYWLLSLFPVELTIVFSHGLSKASGVINAFFAALGSDYSMLGAIVCSAFKGFTCGLFTDIVWAFPVNAARAKKLSYSTTMGAPWFWLLPPMLLAAAQRQSPIKISIETTALIVTDTIVMFYLINFIKARFFSSSTITNQADDFKLPPSSNNFQSSKKKQQNNKNQRNNNNKKQHNNKKNK
eukprot:CAMPEP_0201553116 /NCGR_PEP_ID=MMETSP0173_2-20130828/19454_1 /ASSEMBLY_ACC=CAM_ASM_000268 /TAXON_ID=218659 /ORGANISM="Vexillifera sp., Strain DIVA3 564/2" /LENGTH=281 /DNA_ID=CAMNT_0047963731 /DNA_START=129 /DNA_END=974 /DNA_ORIENTATION=-